jgi:hypothetical protein
MNNQTQQQQQYIPMPTATTTTAIPDLRTIEVDSMRSRSLSLLIKRGANIEHRDKMVTMHENDKFWVAEPLNQDRKPECKREQANINFSV